MTNKLTARKRVIKTLNHERPDRVPIDFGGTANTSIIKEAYDDLRNYLGLPKTQGKFLDIMMRSVEIDSDVKNYFCTDFAGIFPKKTLPVKWLNNKTYIDQWGIKWEKKDNVYYFEQVETPLSGNICINDIINYDWPDPNDIKIDISLKKRATNLRNESNKAIILSLPAPFIHTTQYLRGFEDWFLDCAANQKLIETLFDAVLEINIEIAKKILFYAADYADIIKIADDLGMQNGLQVSPDFFRDFIKPRLKKYTEIIKKYGPNKFIHMHSCGSIEIILNDLIEIGVDVINPVQISAKDMEPKYLKEKYGGKISFWGAIDTQSVLNNFVKEDLKKEIEKIINILGDNGGYILSAVHNIQPDVPPENIVTMFNHGKDYSLKKFACD